MRGTVLERVPVVRSLPSADHPTLVVDILACGHVRTRDLGDTRELWEPSSRPCPKCAGTLVRGVPPYEPSDADAQPARISAV